MTPQKLIPDKAKNSKKCIALFSYGKRKAFFGGAKKKLTFLEDGDFSDWKKDETDIDDFIRSFLY